MEMLIKCNECEVQESFDNAADAEFNNWERINFSWHCPKCVGGLKWDGSVKQTKKKLKKKSK